MLDVLVTLVVPTAAEVPASVVAVARAFPKYKCALTVGLITGLCRC